MSAFSAVNVAQKQTIVLLSVQQWLSERPRTCKAYHNSLFIPPILLLLVNKDGSAHEFLAHSTTLSAHSSVICDMIQASHARLQPRLYMSLPDECTALASKSISNAHQTFTGTIGSWHSYSPTLSHNAITVMKVEVSCVAYSAEVGLSLRSRRRMVSEPDTVYVLQACRSDSCPLVTTLSTSSTTARSSPGNYGLLHVDVEIRRTSRGEAGLADFLRSNQA